MQLYASGMSIKANITFLSRDDAYIRDVEFDVLPREGEDVGVYPLGTAGHRRIDRVERVRHFIDDAGVHRVELLLSTP